MEDSIEIIVYILAMLLGLGATAYRNYAKRKEMERRRTEATGEKRPGLDDIFDMEEQEDAYEEEAMYTRDEEYTEEPSVYEDTQMEQQEGQTYTPFSVEELREKSPEPVSDIETRSEGVAAFKTTQEALISDDMQDKSFEIPDIMTKGEIGKEVEEEEVEEINWTDAIIYSEILKRKY